MAKINDYPNSSITSKDRLLGVDTETETTKTFVFSDIEERLLGIKGDRKLAVESRIDLTTQLVSMVEGSRYINTVTGVSVNTETSVIANYIYEVRSGEWYKLIPSEGFNCWDKTADKNLYFNGTTWVHDVMTEDEIQTAGGVTVGDTDASGFDFVVDEDDMVSDSPVKVPTQQSVKAYTDAVADRATSLESRADNLELNQVTGVVVYDTYADLLALTGTLNVSYKVSNDPDPSNNGYYHWSGSAYVKDASLATGVVESGNVEPVSGDKINDVTKFKLDLIVGKNLFNKDAITSGFYVNGNNGSLVSLTTFNASEFIAVNPSTDYHVQKAGATEYYALYDSDKNYITGVNGGASENYTITTSSTTAFMRISVKDAELDTCILEVGSLYTFYEAYKTEIDETQASNAVVLAIGRNKFNKATITANKYISGSTGLPTSLSGFNASDFIDVEPSTDYYASNIGNDYHAFYDENKVYLSGFQGGNITNYSFTTPSNSKYVRVTILDAYLDTCQVEIGTSASEYSTYENVIVEEKLPESIRRGGNYYFNKKLMQYGDSLTANDSYYMDEFVGIVQPKTYTNKGVSGNTVTQMLARLEADLVATPALLDDIDLLSFFITTNDYNGSSILGTVNDDPDVDTTVCAKYMKAIEVALNANPFLKIMLITPLRRAGGNFPSYGQSNSQGDTIDDYAQKVREIAKKYSIAYLDFNELSGWNELTISSFSSDGVHPNSSSGTGLAKLQSSFINSIG